MKTLKTTLSRLAAIAAFGLLSAIISPIAASQTAGVVTASASPARGTASVTPTITWSTSPVAIGCSISNGSTLVSGLAASGSRAMPAITSSADYTVNCSWSGGTGQALVSWTRPTQNTDNSALTDLAAYRILFGTSASALTQSQNVGPDATSATVASLPNGTWYFAVRAINSGSVESDNSNVPSKVIAVSAVSASKTVTVTVDKKPKPPGEVTVTDPVAYNVVPDLQRFVFNRGSRAGRVNIGAACDESRKTADGYNVISRNSQVSPRPASGTVLVARCG